MKLLGPTLAFLLLMGCVFAGSVAGAETKCLLLASADVMG